MSYFDFVFEEKMGVQHRGIIMKGLLLCWFTIKRLTISKVRVKRVTDREHHTNGDFLIFSKVDILIY